MTSWANSDREASHFTLETLLLLVLGAFHRLTGTSYFDWDVFAFEEMAVWLALESVGFQANYEALSGSLFEDRMHLDLLLLNELLIVGEREELVGLSNAHAWTDKFEVFEETNVMDWLTGWIYWVCEFLSQLCRISWRCSDIWWLFFWSGSAVLDKLHLAPEKGLSLWSVVFKGSLQTGRYHCWAA